jgi:arginase
VDVDVLDSALMPAVDSPQPDGLSYEELRQLLDPFLMSDLVTGIQFTIFDPDLDPEGRYARGLPRAIADALGRARALRVEVRRQTRGNHASDKGGCW